MWKFNPFTSELDYYKQSGAYSCFATYKFIGYIDGEIEDPGIGCMSFNLIEDDPDFYLIINRTEKSGNDISGVVTFWDLFFGLYFTWVMVQSVKDPSVWVKFVLGDESETITDEGGSVIGYKILCWAVVSSETYDAEEDEYTIRAFEDNEDVVISWEWSLSFMYEVPAEEGATGATGPSGLCIPNADGGESDEIFPVPELILSGGSPTSTYSL